MFKGFRADYMPAHRTHFPKTQKRVTGEWWGNLPVLLAWKQSINSAVPLQEEVWESCCALSGLCQILAPVGDISTQMRLHPPGVTLPQPRSWSDLYMPHTLSAFLVLLTETQWECEERTLSLHALLPRTGTTKKSVYVLKMLNEHWLYKTLRYRVRSGEWGQTSFFFQSCDLSAQTFGSSARCNHFLGRKLGLFACLGGATFPLGRQRALGNFPFSLHPWSQELGMILSGLACFWLVWQALVSYQMGDSFQPGIIYLSVYVFYQESIYSVLDAHLRGTPGER